MVFMKKHYLTKTFFQGGLMVAMSLQLIGCAHARGKIDPTVPGKIGISVYPATLGHGGRVIAHEDGVFNFLPLIYCHSINTCPQQLQAMVKENKNRPLEKQIHFVKISIRTLADGTWVIAHDQVQYIVASASSAARANAMGKGIQVLDRLPKNKKFIYFKNKGNIEYSVVDSNEPISKIKKNSTSISSLSSLPSEKIVEIDLSQIDSSQYQNLHNIYGNKFSVYRLGDYTANGLKKYFNYMLYFKTDPNQNIIDDIDRLDINNRVVLESRHNNDAEWVHNHQGNKSGIFFMGRVRNSYDLNTLLKIAPSYGDKLWGIEISGDETPELVKRVNATQYISHVDSMPYDPLKETLFTACEKPLVKINSTTTMTSRPMDCLNKMKPQE